TRGRAADSSYPATSTDSSRGDPGPYAATPASSHGRRSQTGAGRKRRTPKEELQKIALSSGEVAKAGGSACASTRTSSRALNGHFRSLGALPTDRADDPGVGGSQSAAAVGRCLA